MQARFAVAILSASLITSGSAANAGAQAMAKAEKPIAGATQYKKPSDAELKKRLTAIQYDVTQNAATEPPFHNQYWDNHEDGIYVDVVTGAPLFSSLDKFESATGWPSFTKPLEAKNVMLKTDTQFGMVRNEVRSVFGDAHLGHLFDDGPAPTGMRYCMNSAAMRFIPVAKLEAEGYGRYVPLFQKSPAKSAAHR